MNLNKILNTEFTSQSTYKSIGSFNGYVDDIKDALLLLEGAKYGIIKLTNRRLNNTERVEIKSGSTFIFEERSSGVQRWTDGRRWTTSRLCDHFLLYRQTDTQFNPLIKKTLSVITSNGKRLSIINYYIENDIDNNLLTRPRDCPLLKELTIPINHYFRCIAPVKKSDSKTVTLIPLNGTEEDHIIMSRRNSGSAIKYLVSPDISTASSFNTLNYQSRRNSTVLPSIHTLLQSPQSENFFGII